ncbi:hypothetical protein [Gracilibacillus saliphilus]|uniref:hypothetical protein n=1 Tax=Gracilibacillus saliphilus TaxID=543890 RepID=UPI001EE29BDA|nr:hypothetical protein [Gracilibacillus saliphilus]
MGKSRLIVIMMVSVVILGGCGELLKEIYNYESSHIDNGVNGKDPEVLMPVQEYTGEEYTLRNGKETDKNSKCQSRSHRKSCEAFF